MRSYSKILLTVSVLAMIVGGTTLPSHAISLVISTAGPASLPSATASPPTIAFTDGDLITFDTDTNTATKFADASLFDDEDIDALFIRQNGNIIISSINSGILGGQAYNQEDLAEIDPNTMVGSLFLDGGIFFNVPSGIGIDLDAAHVRSNGNILFSTSGASTTIVGGVAFDENDIVELNPNDGSASVIFDGSALLGGGDAFNNLSGISELANGNLLLSVSTGSASSVVTLGGIGFTRDDIVEYNPTTMTASLLFEGLNFFSNSGEIIDAIHVIESVVGPGPGPGGDPIPEPSTILLLGSGLAGLGL